MSARRALAGSAARTLTARLASTCGILAVACAALALSPPPAGAASQPVELAAPYEYLGWGDPQPPASVIEATGVRDITLAFILSHRACNPEWDGERPLLGGSDQAAIESVRAAGGEVDVSFGGWSGKKLGNSCKTPAALAAAYQKVIDDYSLKAIDVDIEHTEFTAKKVRKRVIEALAIVRAQNPGLEISVTFGTEEGGPERDGVSLIDDAAAIGFQPSAWTIMPFDFGRPLTDMGHASIKAVEGLQRDLVAAYARLMESADSQVRNQAASSWGTWEDVVLSLEPNARPLVRSQPDRFVLAFVRICAHYFSHAAWLEDSVVIRDAPRLAGIPGVLIHGRLDLSCPVDTAWELAHAWPGAELLIDDHSGHLGSDTKRAWMLSTLARFASY